MTPTEELRAKLDERGVEWNAIDGDDMCLTEWRTHGGAFVYTARESLRSYGDNDLRVETCGIPRSCLIATPEQAIAATLGSADTYTREEVEGEFVSGYSLGLDMFDQSKLDFEKGWNKSMRHLDEEMAERGWVRKEAATSSFATADGTLHIRCLALPKRVEVTLPDERGRDVYSARVYLFEPEQETCKLSETRSERRLEDK